MDRERIGELLAMALNEPKPPDRLVERTCWKARAAETRLQANAPKKPEQKAPEAQKKGPSR